ncbi:MAG: hypothetical protein ABI887_02800, partial [Burkholderiales bacterium]
MSFQFRGIAPLRVLAATLLLLGMGQARAADWEAGDVTYHSTCAGSGCHSSNPLLPGDAGHSPANEFVDAATLQGFIDGGMGGSATSALSATSVQNIADYLGNLAYPVAALSGGTALADVPLSQTSTQTFTLSSSHGTLTVGSIKVMNGAVEDATNFSVALHACTTVTTATPCAFDVTFQPKSVGSFSRTLTILHNDQRGVSTAALSVSGLAPFTVNSSALDFTASSAPAGMLPKTLTDRVGGVRICRADASTFNFPADFSI